ncbi:MAG: Uma2 family endonuclease [Isosphaeraceae bacterium]
MSTASPIAPPTPPITAEEFAARPDPGYPEELVKGRIVAMTQPGIRHGLTCCQASFLLRLFLQGHDLGRVLTNDSGVITGRNPDTVRGADVAFYSYNRLPRGDRPTGLTAAVPELVVEVLSPSDRWTNVVAKIGDYLGAGVTAVLILDDDTQSAHVYRGDTPPTTLGPDDTLTFPDILPGFEAPVRSLFG